MVHNNNIKRNDTCDNYYFQLYVDVTQINNDNMLNQKGYFIEQTHYDDNAKILLLLITRTTE